MIIVRRIVLMVFLTVWIGVMWKWIGQSAWAGSLDVASAGEQFTHPIESLRMVTGAILIAVPSVLLIRDAWNWLERRVLGRTVKNRVPGLRR